MPVFSLIVGKRINLSLSFFFFFAQETESRGRCSRGRKKADGERMAKKF